MIVVGSAVLALLLDRRDFTDTGEALWWSLQTVTTVGYGDVVPVTTHGRIIAGVVMLLGIAASSVLTAFVTSALYEAALRRHGKADERRQRLLEAARRASSTPEGQGARGLDAGERPPARRLVSPDLAPRGRAAGPQSADDPG